MIPTWPLVVLTLVVAGWSVWTYNRIVSLQQRAGQAWSDIDAQLKRRYDLVPALVETVKGYAAHERTTLEEVVARRGVAAQAAAEDAAPLDRSRRENQLVGALRGLFALAEDYPELRASERFGLLQQQLADIEDHLQHARRYYNAVIRDLNIVLARFPDLVVGRAFGFEAREFFELESPMERQAVPVRWQEDDRAQP